MCGADLWSRHAWAPLAAIAFAFAPQRGVEFEVVDGPNDQCFGSLLIWQCDSIFSMEFIWYSGPLAIDAAAYSLAAFCVVWVWRRLPIPTHRIVSALFKLAVWIAGLGSICLVLFAIVALGQYGGGWTDPIPPEDIVEIGWGQLFFF
jgi:hypothetical protein